MSWHDLTLTERAMCVLLVLLMCAGAILAVNLALTVLL